MADWIQHGQEVRGSQAVVLYHVMPISFYFTELFCCTQLASGYYRVVAVVSGFARVLHGSSSFWLCASNYSDNFRYGAVASLLGLSFRALTTRYKAVSSID